MNLGKVQNLLTVLIVVLGLIYFWPGGYFLENLEFRLFGWPFFALWVVVIAPMLGITIFYLKCRIENRREKDGV